MARSRPEPRPCSGTTIGGAPCSNTTTNPSGRCFAHQFARIRTQLDQGQADEAVAVADFDPFGSAGAPATHSSTRWFGHANDAVRRPSEVDLSRLEHLAGKNIVTVDLDGTIYGREVCGHELDRSHPNSFGWDDDCDHVRSDIVQRIKDVCAQHDAIPVILSWRAGGQAPSAAWLDHVGFDRSAMFLPGADDDCAGLRMHWAKDGRIDHTANRKEFGSGQVAFKSATVQVLQEQGCNVVAGFDDNPEVTRALSELGVDGAELIDVPGRSHGDCLLCREPLDPVNNPPAYRKGKLCRRCVSAPTSTLAAASQPRLVERRVPARDESPSCARCGERFGDGVARSSLAPTWCTGCLHDDGPDPDSGDEPDPWSPLESPWDSVISDEDRWASYEDVPF